MPTMQSWQVSQFEHGRTLLDFLSEHLRVSRRRAKALLDTRAVFVNRRRIWMARHVLRSGDVVEAQTNDKPARSLVSPEVLLLFEDEHYMIVNKPAGMAVDGPRGVETAYRRQFGSGEIALVHRLDRDTSGCLILAKNRAALDAIVPLFEQRRVVKVYHVLVAGLFPKNVRTIRKDVDGQMAVTHVMRLSANARASHLRVRIETGRTHQIRKHMAALRHPVLGDRQYATGPLKDPLLRSIPRQMLHASQIAFAHPFSGTMIQIKAPLPADFRDQLKRLRLT